MCGITGFIDFNISTNKQTLEDMIRALKHRGPDGTRTYFDETGQYQVGMAHARLSIIDLSDHAFQPMYFNDLAIIFNGEVYNFKEIRADLEKLGYTFTTSSDTEVVLKAFHRWDIKALDKFIGMFAFVIYDKAKMELILIRDRAGVKPLYYYQHNRHFLFGSELKSFYQNSNFEKKINNDSLASYFKGGYIPFPNTIFQNCYKLAPGNFLKLDLNTGIHKIEKYWDIIDFFKKAPTKYSEKEILEETERIMVSAFNYRMVSDVPVGVFLSGGYDSTAVAAILQKDRIERIKTFTIGFHEESFNEAPFANSVARHLGTDHYEYYCTVKDALEIIPTLPEIYDEPFADSSAIPTILVSRFAKQHVTVSLSADGGDEQFAGYGKYFGFKNTYALIGNLPLHVRRLLTPAGFALKQLSFIPYIEDRLEILNGLLKSKDVLRLQLEPAAFSNAELNSLLISRINPVQSSFDDFKILPDSIDSLNRMLAVDYKTYMIDDILCKVDRATMSVSLEGREPLLDHRLAEFLATVPGSLKTKNNIPKYLLKQIVHKYIPKGMMDRKKMGFGVPVIYWFKNELKDYFLHYINKERLEKDGIINADFAVKIRDQYLYKNNSQYQTEMLFNKLWYILMFEMWKEKWL